MQFQSGRSAKSTSAVTRRELLQTAGAVGLGGGLVRQSSAQTVAKALPTRIKSCILIFYYGGPSHLDTFDMKPDAPTEVRGEFQPIATSVPGLRIGEHLPRTARVMHKVAVIHGMQHQMRGHDSASYEALTGRVPPVGDNQNFKERPDTFPSYGACLNYFRRNHPSLIPHVSLPFVMNNNFQTPGQTAGFLGTEFQPLLIQGDPATMTYHAGGALKVLDLPAGVSIGRLESRWSLLRFLDAQPRHGSARSMSLYQEKVFNLLRSGTLREALNVQQESQATREHYGHGLAGQPFDDNSKSPKKAELAIARNLRGWNLLVARRLVEAGVPFINVYDYKQQGKNWDSHSDNFGYLRKYLLPSADQAFAALIEDLEQRGLLETTLVMAVGEFGRTPKINKNAGRDHWP
ncbi:MAG TPA: DUF1501 domain-containing protein, partial [Planctomycetaceae bacterium]|nr:DUF1501 domain-containing protein [Planctomycetaceae bacterium]